MNTMMHVTKSTVSGDIRVLSSLELFSPPMGMDAISNIEPPCTKKVIQAQLTLALDCLSV